ncbi:MAG TPA: triose-phosphate isomerase [Acidobacteriaceae bacterium]|jgi:triosephosphate isomerase|nr:triose-phosphate isomerase [Acidobacteriaceae bacterium]
MRTPVIAANWKMYKTPAEAESFVTAFLPLVEKQSKGEIVLCPATPDLTFVLKAVAGSAVHVGAQNMHFAEEGAYTGETSAAMLTALGITHVILGHSERRQYFAETDQTVHQKLKTALKHRLIPIVCIGERLEEREGGKTEEVLTRQIGAAIGEIAAAELTPMIVAYEPVWAIGTGKTATPEMAADAHRLIRGEVARLKGAPLAEGLRILYGGSVKPDNAAALMSQPEIDGALVGGASLDPQSFAKIVASSQSS